MTTSDASANCCLIVGAGPAGMAPLISAAHAGKLRDLLDAGITIVEQGETVGAGTIGRYAIRSDSAAEAFLDAILRTTEPRLAALKDHPIALAIQEMTGGPVPLELVAAYLQLIGETLCSLVAASPRGVVLTGHTAISTRRTGAAAWTTRVRCNRTGREQEYVTSSVVLACGATQPLGRLAAEKVAGMPLLPTYEAKILQSGEVLTPAGLSTIASRLQQVHAPRVVVVGGSTSAAAVVRALLEQLPAIEFGPKAVTLMHRRPLRIFYNDANEALRDGYTDFSDKDVCRISGRVYRLAGFRLESRELMMRALGVGGRPSEPRLRLHSLETGSPVETRRLLDEADIVIAAMGYRPTGLAVLDESLHPIALHGATNVMRALVNDDCQVMAHDRSPIQGLYAIGLATGLVPQRLFGGEESFRGQANSLWLWQHGIGERIVDAVGRDHAGTMKQRVLERRMQAALNPEEQRAHLDVITAQYAALHATQLEATDRSLEVTL